MNDAIPYSPPIVEMNTKYKLTARDIMNMSIDAGIPTFKMSLAILESNLNSFKLTFTYVSFLMSIQYRITDADPRALTIVARDAPAEPNPNT